MFKNEIKINEIQYNSKYVSGKALEVITDFTNNTYIIKGSTGNGGTHSILNYTKGNCLIISPNVGMIKSKEDKRCDFLSDKQFFIYEKSDDKWNELNDWLNISTNIIINTTPNQIIKIKNKNKELYNQLIKIPIFIDEIHAFTVSSNYRDEVGHFLELVYNEWNAPFKLSTATPNYNYLDVPTDKNITYYKITKADQNKRKLKLSSNLKDAKQFIMDEHHKGRLVIVFTNNPNYHKSFKNLNVKNLVGLTLDLKLKPFERGNYNGPDIYENTDIIFASSSFFAGYDITKDCSICIISEQKNHAYQIHINDVVQAYGRCRTNVHNALFVNSTATHDQDGNEIKYLDSINDVNNMISTYPIELTRWHQTATTMQWYSSINYKQITPQLYTNRAVILAPILQCIYDYQLYNESVLKSVLESYNFIVTDYINPNPTANYTEKKTPFKTILNNLLKQNEMELLYGYFAIKRSLKFKKEGNYSVKLALQYLSAYLLKITNATSIINKLDNQRVKPNEFYNSMDLFLRSNVNTSNYYNQLTPQQINSCNRLYFSKKTTNILKNKEHLTNDWQILYACHKITNNILPKNVEREIKLYDIFYDTNLYIEKSKDKNRIRNTVRVILKRCMDSKITLNTTEYIWLDEVVKGVYKALNNTSAYVNSNTRKSIKKKMLNALIYFLTEGLVSEFEEIKSREYNPLTQLPAKFRCIIPIKYVSIDLASANPQITDSILKTNIALNIYNNLMNKRGITRDQAKKLYNSTLNNHRLSVYSAKKIYLDCGYDEVNSKQLAEMTAGVQKGTFYELMTANEKKLMENYSNILPFKSYRFHDAIIVKFEDLLNYNITLPTLVCGYKYHIELFNDYSTYNGPISNIPNNGIMIENMVHLS
ncbi:DEAD/DEAH box helicase family protein [Gaetbulibacter saemankumensis]|uniref:DEAD/DEAH box helicase family protein n=1 Tax=Gaetbulibacter saemankumensis TaxID=311208 RepID=UPI00041B3DDF|nr:DEAD/DEAH box helicase family protein [Gaetbulibacter saemankumensis]